MQVLVLGVLEKGLERLLGGPLDEDYHRARFGARLSLLDLVQPPQRHHPPAVLTHGLGRATRVLPVGIVFGQVEQVEGVQRHSYCAAIFVFTVSGPS